MRCAPGTKSSRGKTTDTRMFLRADKAVPYGEMMEVMNLSLPKTRFEHSDGVVRQGPDTRQCRRTVRRAVCRAHPSRAKHGSEPHCNRSRISRGFAMPNVSIR